MHILNELYNMNLESGNRDFVDTVTRTYLKHEHIEASDEAIKQLVDDYCNEQEWLEDIMTTGASLDEVYEWLEENALDFEKKHLKESLVWENYGDVNFEEHGGTLLKKAFNEEEIKKHPSLYAVYDVFRVDVTTEGKFAYLGSVDASDYNREFTYANRNNIQDTEMEMTVIDVVDNEGYGSCNAVGYKTEYPSTYRDLQVSDKELRVWLKGIEFYEEIAPEVEKAKDDNVKEVLAEIEDEISSRQPFILPYGLETSGIIEVEGIMNVPLTATDYQYLSYKYLDGENWYWGAFNSIEEASRSNPNTTIIENPILNMTSEEIQKCMDKGMKEEASRNPKYMEKYLENAHFLYHKALETEMNGGKFFVKSEDVKKVIDKYEDTSKTTKQKAKKEVERND